MANGDIHNRKGKIKRSIKRIKDKNKGSKHNRELIINFKDYIVSQDLSIDRISRYLTWKKLLLST